MMSSTKPEVYNVSQRRRRMRGTEQTDRHTDTHAQYYVTGQSKQNYNDITHKL